MSKKRVIKIVEYLSREQHMVSGKELGTQLGVNARTIRQDISQYRGWLNSFGISIISEGRNGYRIQAGNEDIKNLHLSYQLDEPALDDMETRIRYILDVLLNSKEWLTIDELSEQIWVSRSTMNRIIKKILEILKPYNIAFVTRPRYGIRLEGRELDKRVCYVQWCVDSENINDVISLCGITVENYYKIEEILFQMLSKNAVMLQDSSYRSLVLHIVVAMKRIENGNIIEDNEISETTDSKEYQLACEIVDKITSQMNVNFPEEEIKYIQLHLKGKRILSEKYDFTNSEIEDLLGSINSKIKEKLGYDFSDDAELFEALAVHLQPMITRAKYGFSFSNPVLKDIKIQFPRAVDLAAIAASEINRNIGRDISDSELGYIALHYALAMDRNVESKKSRDVALICSEGIGSVLFVKYKIQKQLKIPDENIKVLNINNYMNFDFSTVEYVVSTVRLPQKIDRKVVYLENILDDFDMTKTQEISNLELLNGVVANDSFYLHIDMSSKEEVLEYLCEDTTQKKNLDGEFKKLVMERERLSTTEIGDYVAVPHPLSLCTDETFMVVCILNRPIIWEKQKVKYIFMVSYSRDSIEDSVKMNEKLFEKITNKEWLKLLSGVNNTEDLRKLLD